MKNYHVVLVSLYLLFFSCSPKESNQEDTSVKPKVNLEILANGNLRYLKLTGSPYQRGFEHGKLLKKDIQDVIELLYEDIRSTTGIDPKEFITLFLEQTDYLSSVEEYTPELLEEVKGISDGSGVEFETIFMHQLGDEYWFNTKDVMAHSCSSFGVNKTAKFPSITAQNMDIPEFFHGFQTVIKASESNSSKEVMYLSVPGHLGLTGMNNQSVSINCNTLMQLDYAKTGLPVTFIVRGVLSKDTQEEALDFLKQIHHASGQNYILGGPERV